MFKININFSGQKPPKAPYSRMSIDEIYGYLLQKREENQLKLMRNTPKGKVIDTAYTEIEPVSPNKYVIPALGLIFGIGGGFILTNLIVLRRNSRNRKTATSSEA